MSQPVTDVVTDLPELTCEVCKAEPAVGVAAMPGVPYSAAYGRQCLAANAHPYEMVVANTAMIGGLDEAADWWVEIVEDTLRHLDKDREAFDAQVRVEIALYQAWEREEDARRVEAAETHLRERGVLPPEAPQP